MKKRLIAWALFDEEGKLDGVYLTKTKAEEVKLEGDYFQYPLTIKKVEIKVINK